MKIIRIVSRKSALALWQANFVKTQLQHLNPELSVEIIGITTEGDKDLESSLAKIGGKGLFVKALEEYLLNNEADLAVHSLKDMPVILPEGLEIAAILKREDVRDALISFEKVTLKDLPSNAIIGTSSLRRQSQLYAFRKDLQFKLLRGNVGTRLQKLDKGEYQAIILAAAGLKRLQLEDRIVEYLAPDIMLPAVGQGALCIECRRENTAIKELIAPLHHLPTAYCTFAERSMNAALGGSCQLPIAALGTLSSTGALRLQGMVGTPDGQILLKAEQVGPPEEMLTIGQQVAEQLFQKGAKKIIEACNL